MKKSKYNINTGRMLDNFLRKNNIAKSSLASDINRNKVSVLQYTENVSIQTGILIDICYALKYNFFQDLANALPKEFNHGVVIEPEKATKEQEQQALLAQLQEENKVLKIQNELLMKMKL